MAAARRLSRTVPFPTISLEKTNEILGKPIDISKSQESSDDEDDAVTIVRGTKARRARSSRRSSSPSTNFAQGDREVMLSQSSSFRDLESLFGTLDAMEEWKNLADEGVKLVPSQTSAVDVRN